MDFISPEDIITYNSIVKEGTREYHNLVYSEQQEPHTIKDNYQDPPSLTKACSLVIGQSANKALKQVDFKTS